MNAKTAKLIRRFAVAKGVPYRATKRAYNRHPKRRRFQGKEEIRQSLFERSNKLSPADAKRVVLSVFGAAHEN